MRNLTRCQKHRGFLRTRTARTIRIAQELGVKRRSRILRISIRPVHDRHPVRTEKSDLASVEIEERVSGQRVVLFGGVKHFGPCHVTGPFQRCQRSSSEQSTVLAGQRRTPLEPKLRHKKSPGGDSGRNDPRLVVNPTGITNERLRHRC